MVLPVNCVRLFIVLVFSGLLGCKTNSSDSDSSELRVGMDLGYPPFEMLDKQGNPDGVSVRMAEALAKDLGRPLKIVPMDFFGLIPALQMGNIDLILSSMTRNEERAKSIDFSEPYAFTGLAMLVAKSSALTGVEDLRNPGSVIAVKTATTGEMWTREHLPDAKLVVFEDAAACVLEVVQGRADAFLYDQLSIFRHAKENPETTRGILDPFVEEQWAIGVAKGNGDLLKDVNGFLEGFRDAGGFSRLRDEFLQEEKKFLKRQGVPFLLR